MQQRKAEAGSKMVSVKMVGSNQPTQTVAAAPGATVRDLLKKLGLDPVGYEVSHASRPEAPFGQDDVLYAMVEDGDLLHCSSKIVAGSFSGTNRALWLSFVAVRGMVSFLMSMVRGLASVRAQRRMVERRARRLA
jgi:hypothetical protein